MAKAPVKKKSVRVVSKPHINPFNVYWDKKNYLFLALGALLVVIGFFVMSVDPWNSSYALVLSPIILLIAYLIIFPLAIMKGNKNNKPTEQEQEIAAGKS